MKYNHSIDFFSSPNSKFIGFSDIRHPQIEINNHSQNMFESIEEERKMFRKLSFTASNIVEPILPFGNDFFQEKLQECCEEENEEYRPQRDHHQIQENSLMMGIHLQEQQQLHTHIERSPQVKMKEHDFISTPNTMRIQCQDMPHYVRKQQNSVIKCKIQSSHIDQIYTTPKRKAEFFTVRKSCESTAEKSMSRNNEKGLRRLSSLAYSIVSQSSTTTYKQVAQKLLTHLNFTSNDMQDQDGAEKSSMQNVKRRVYDSLNVLLALGVIKRVGSKIAKQKQRKPFTADNSPDLERYNQMLTEYNERVKALQTRKKTERELKEKLQIFRKTVERNRKVKPISKNKMIRLPFLVFVAKEEGQVQWVKKSLSQNNSNERKKVIKRVQGKEYDKQKSSQDLIVKVTFNDYPDSYGDLDFFKLLNHHQQQDFTNNNKNELSSQSKPAEKVSSYLNNNLNRIQEFEDPMQEYAINVNLNKSNGQMMNLIDEVLGQE